MTAFTVSPMEGEPCGQRQHPAESSAAAIRHGRSGVLAWSGAYPREPQRSGERQPPACGLADHWGSRYAAGESSAAIGRTRTFADTHRREPNVATASGALAATSTSAADLTGCRNLMAATAGYVVAVIAHMDPPVGQRISGSILNRLPEPQSSRRW